MNTIQSFIQAARERKAQEIVMGPDRPLQFRIGKDLIAVSGKDLSISDSKNFVAQILNEEEKRSLYQDFRVQGLKNLSGISFKFDFQIDFSGISGTVQLSDQTPKTWGFPRNVPESLMRPQGLHILTGPRRSGKSTAIVDIVNQCKNQNRNIACFVEGENQLLNLGSMNISQFPIEQLRKNHIPRGADVIIIDSDNAADCEKALELAEKGYNVLICLPFWNIQMAIERFLDLCSGSENSQARRLSSVLHWVIGCQLMPGLESPLCSAFELLSVNSEVQNLLKKRDISTLARVMNDKTEKLGMRTMNQSLFQLLMKRKIELKTAFEFSPAPEDLDLILKKVGV